MYLMIITPPHSALNDARAQPTSLSEPPRASNMLGTYKLLLNRPPKLLLKCPQHLQVLPPKLLLNCPPKLLLNRRPPKLLLKHPPKLLLNRRPPKLLLKRPPRLQAFHAALLPHRTPKRFQHAKHSLTQHSTRAQHTSSQNRQVLLSRQALPPKLLKHLLRLRASHTTLCHPPPVDEDRSNFIDARSKQSAPSKPPKLLTSELTPEAAQDWENACATYFMHKEIEPQNQVKMVAFGMLDPRLHTWYLAQRVTLDVGTFLEYMTALKGAWLETHWDTKLQKKVLGSQQGGRAFYEWALELQNQNTLLYGNAAHLTDAQLRNQLEANICDDLTTAEVRHLDDKRLEDLAMHKRLADEAYKTSRRTNQSYTASKTTYSLLTNNSAPRLGPLTVAERTLLADNKGCFKCRKFYVSHRLRECPDGAPEASSYKTITEADAMAAKTKNERSNRSVPIAAVAPVTAMMPSSVLEDLSDSNDDTCMAPFETAHII
ncbi:uncharacterized protein F5891DRAFT_1195168 [Suillus fuscotomentosus]|uniref:Uncharacterized protein n=1 Tax=Suillus fuscotomentosus TaxID=1912939 RepID=A0AAD4HFA5_9AGAM|nr:uncharacterized protein F5891DRAFT_1195168 [Suillus fuscotomentosus]KAG1894463.1 hypothetical protein F5891DRAFT_1195168 [Suillus fuscotomentosus]